MKKYYTDPLKVIWMARNHDVWFAHEWDEQRKKLYPKLNYAYGFGFYYINLYREDGINYQVNQDEKFYVHPDCHEMLKPQIGDIVSGITKIGLRNRVLQEVLEGAEEAAEKFIEMGCQIIQRNGKAFFIPEVDNG